MLQAPGSGSVEKKPGRRTADTVRRCWEWGPGYPQRWKIQSVSEVVRVLEITPSAAEVIRQMIDNVAAVNGIRVAQGPSQSTNGDAPQLHVTIAPAAGPLEEDEMIVEDGIAVFVDPDIAPMLDDKLLDLIPVGSEQVQFTLTDQQQT